MPLTNVYLNLGNIYKEIAILPMAHVSNCFPKELTICSTSWSQFSSDRGGSSQMEGNKEPYYQAAFAQSFEPHRLPSSQFAQCSSSRSELPSSPSAPTSFGLISSL